MTQASQQVVLALYKLRGKVWAPQKTQILFEKSAYADGVEKALIKMKVFSQNGLVLSDIEFTCF